MRTVGALRTTMIRVGSVTQSTEMLEMRLLTLWPGLTALPSLRTASALVVGVLVPAEFADMLEVRLLTLWPGLTALPSLRTASALVVGVLVPAEFADMLEVRLLTFWPGPARHGDKMKAGLQ